MVFDLGSEVSFSSFGLVMLQRLQIIGFILTLKKILKLTDKWDDNKI